MISRSIGLFQKIIIITLFACVSYCRDMNKRITEEQARLSYERTVKLEQEFGEYFTGTKQGQISCWKNIESFKQVSSHFLKS